MSADAFVAENEKDAELDDVVADGSERIFTVGEGDGGADCAAVIVQVATACDEPVGLATRTANVWLPVVRPAMVNGDVHAKAGGFSSSAHVVVTAPCDVHEKVAVAADVIAGGCWTNVTVGSATNVECAVGSGRAGVAPARMPPMMAATAEEARKRARDIWINSDRRGADEARH